MKALILTNYNEFHYTDVLTPIPNSNEVLIRIKACSICGSDIHGYQGGSDRRIPPIIMGHEASGIIEKLGDNVKNYKIGDRVTFDSTQYCGQCEFCQKQMTNLCNSRKVIGVSCDEFKNNGAMAEFVLVDAHTLYPLPDSVSFVEACLVEPFSVALHAVQLSNIQKSDRIVIIGDGTIGLLTLQAVLALGRENEITLIGKHQTKLNTACSYPQVHTINKTNFEATQDNQSLNVMSGFDIIYDTVGTTSTMNDAFSYVKKGGKIICIGNTSKFVNFPLQECITRQIQIYGSYSSSGEYSLALKLMDEKAVDLSAFTKHIYPLSNGAQAFKLLTEKKTDLLKVILKTENN